MKKLKIKKKIKRLSIVMILLIVATIFGLNKYKEYKYKQTNEYKLTQVGYTLEESKEIVKKLNDVNENYFVENEKNKYVIDLLKEKYFMEKNLFKYLEYKEQEEDKILYDVVAIVNVNASNEWYDVDFIKSTDMTKGNLILVNKFNSLDKEYIPVDIESISLEYSYIEKNNKGYRATKETKEAYTEMANAAQEEGITLLVNSGYRSYSEQEAVYKDYYYSKGLKYADQYAARAGYSEHQTGLSLDIFTNDYSNTENFDESKAFEWLSKNAHKFGFILRYPEGKEYLTGYNYESWHYRYLGKDIAKKVYESGLTYDEYYAFYLDK